MEQLPVILAATLIWLAAIVSPGPCFVIVSRLALSRSRPSAIGAAIGIAAASLIYAGLTMFGLSAVLLRFAWLGGVLRIAGGAYLVWLGIQAWRAGSDDLSFETTSIARIDASLTRGLGLGFLKEISNPKAIAFFLGLFAVMVPASTPIWAKLALLSLGGAMEIVWFAIVALILSIGPMRASYQRLQQRWDRIFGSLLIALGLKIAFDTC